VKKRWLIAAALVAGAACAETTRKDIDRNKSGNASPASARANPDSKFSSENSDQTDDNTYSVDCETTKEGMVP